MIKKFYNWKDFDSDIEKIKKWLNQEENSHITKICGIPKGGLILAATLANHLPDLEYLHNLKDVDKNTLIVDDISDSGKTLLKIPNILGMRTLTLFCKEKTSFQPKKWLNTVEENEWLVFPWESNEKEEVKDETKLY